MMKKILLIEDNVYVLENTAAILDLAGYEVKAVSNGREAVEQAVKFIPDVILCDIMMPEMDGYDVLNEVRKNRNLLGIPFIFLTALSKKNEVRKGMNMGADDYITKPFEDLELIEAIESRLKKNEFLKKDFNKNLKGIDTFISEALQYTELERLSKGRTVQKYETREYIYREGMTAHQLYFIISGSVKTFRTTSGGKELVTGMHGEGEFIGQLSLLHKKGLYLESAITLKDDTETYSVPKNVFTELLYGNNEISNKFIGIISNDLIEAQDHLIDMAYASVRQRAAKALLELQKSGVTLDQNTSAIGIPREDFAGMIGTATETAIRTLSDFREEGLIKIDSNRRILITDIKALEEIADSDH
jgi:CheY-like chemotaxis protein